MPLSPSVRGAALAAILVASPAVTDSASAALNVSAFNLLANTTGTPPLDQTGVFVASITGTGTIASVTIQDNSGGLGGSPGAFSGFDLDAIVLSTQLIADATLANALIRSATFDFANTVLVPGTQRPPPDPALFGTIGGQVDNTIATLDDFDAVSTTGPAADGFVSLGDNGRLSLNLTAPITLSAGDTLYLYIGEVGNNGEVAASSITVSDTPVRVPEPASLALLGMGLLGLGFAARRRA